MAHYILDTNIFIQPHKDWPADIWCSYWRQFARILGSGDIVSIKHVWDEISQGKDDLEVWVKTHVSLGFFLEYDASIMQQHALLQKWAESQHYKESACIKFANIADSYLIATAKAKGLVVVTFEKSNPQATSRILIPDACNAMGVKCIDLNTMLREMNITI